MNWAWQLEHSIETPLPGKSHYQHKSDLDKEVKEQVKNGAAKNQGKFPRVLVIGALGRCGSGALTMCQEAGIPEENLMKWDMAETAKGGPFTEIREADVCQSGSLPLGSLCAHTHTQVFVNCIYLDKKIPKFITTEFLKEGKRNLSVVCDVSVSKFASLP